MYYPTIDEFKKYVKKYNTIPVYKTLLSDSLTPVSAYRKLANTGNSFLLESVIGGEKIAQYSFIGSDPSLVYKAKGRRAEVITGAGHTEEELDDPIGKLADLMAKYTPAHVAGLPRFSGGAVGYFGYDTIRYIENLPNRPPDDMELDDLCFSMFDKMVIFDHINKTVKVVVNAHIEKEKDIQTIYNETTNTIDDLIERLKTGSRATVDEINLEINEDIAYTSTFAKEDFERAVETCKEYIRAGDIFQIVLSQRLSAPSQAQAFDIYRALRVINPSPYMFFLKYDDVALIGSSPEVMVRVEQGKATLRPIAGTRPRGRDNAHDRELAEELLQDPKELAEHTMLVDLGRNDLGRVCKYGTVVVDEKMVIERYSHVMHIVSNVTGELDASKSALDTLRACIPAGTVSGAPKIRAMEIIDELEPVARGPYAGAVGYIDFSGNMDTCITIRTVIVKDKTAYVQAGAGIVADSVPEREYQETINKAKGLLKAITMAQKGFSKG